MIVGHCKWGKSDDEPDVLTLYRVFDAPQIGPMLIENPVGKMEFKINEKEITMLDLYIDHSNSIDEIRIGADIPSVIGGKHPPGK